MLPMGIKIHDRGDRWLIELRFRLPKAWSRWLFDRLAPGLRERARITGTASQTVRGFVVQIKEKTEYPAADLPAKAPEE
jgi:hypothetical protein